MISALKDCVELRPEESPAIPLSAPLLSYFLLAAATQHPTPGALVLNGLHLKNASAGIVNLSDLALLPICWLMIATITQRESKFLSSTRILSYAFPIGSLLLLLVLGRLFEDARWFISAAMTVAAIGLFWWRIPLQSLASLSFFGRISYGFYVFHMPMMILAHNLPLGLSGAWGFSVRFALWLISTVLFSWLLEIVIQPRIKKYFGSRHQAALAHA